MIHTQEIGSLTITISRDRDNLILCKIKQHYWQGSTIYRDIADVWIDKQGEQRLYECGLKKEYAHDFIRCLQIGMERTMEIFNNQNKAV